MPNRGIKESVCTSKTLAKLSAEAERLFFRILVNCDDYGRMEADIDILISKCFPRSYRDIDIEQMQSWLIELQQEILFVYENNGNKYLQIITWEKHNKPRAANSKYPDPDDCESTILQSCESECLHMQANVRTSTRTVHVHEHEHEQVSVCEKNVKTKYAEFVSLKDDEYSSLVEKLGNEEAVKRCIEILDNYKGSKGKKYKSDYRAILSWVIEKYEKEKLVVKPFPIKKAVGEGMQDLRQFIPEDYK